MPLTSSVPVTTTSSRGAVGAHRNAPPAGELNYIMVLPRDLQVSDVLRINPYSPREVILSLTDTEPGKREAKLKNPLTGHTRACTFTSISKLAVVDGPTLVAARKNRDRVEYRAGQPNYVPEAVHAS